MFFLKLYIILYISILLVTKLIYIIYKKRYCEELEYILIVLISFYIPILTYVIFN